MAKYIKDEDKDEEDDDEGGDYNLRDGLVLLAGLFAGYQIHKNQKESLAPPPVKTWLKPKVAPQKLPLAQPSQPVQANPLQEFYNEWKPWSDSIEKKQRQLRENKINFDFDSIPDDIAINIKEALRCFLLEANMAAYVIAVRSVEFIVNHLYGKHKDAEDSKNGFFTASKQLDWVKKKGHLREAEVPLVKAYLEARNDSTHVPFNASDLQVLGLLEQVADLSKRVFSGTGSAPQLPDQA